MRRVNGFMDSVADAIGPFGCGVLMIVYLIAAIAVLANLGDK